MLIALAEINTEVNLGSMLAIATVAIMGFGYILDRRTERRERKEGQERNRQQAEDNIRKQEQMHVENVERLNAMIRFRDTQERVNEARDAQLNQLTLIAATTSEALRGFNRRLEIIEDEVKEARRRAS